eukprot:s295_g8.t1
MLSLEVFTDSDRASDKTSRRSVSCATMFVGGCLLFSSSRTQKLVSLSSAEAKVYSCSSGASDAIMLARLIAWMTGFKVTVHLHTDSSGARGILPRQGVGRVRRLLWLQDLINSGQTKLATVAGAVSPADIGTKRLRLPCNRLKSLMCMIGMSDVARGSLVGADDPGNVLRIRSNLMTILSALSLMSLKGCETEDPVATQPNASPSLALFAFLLDLLCVFFWRWMRNEQHAEVMHEEPDAELWFQTMSPCLMLKPMLKRLQGSGEGETQSQVARRYTNCGQSEASDPDSWAYLHLGMEMMTLLVDMAMAVEVPALQDSCVFNFRDECWDEPISFRNLRDTARTFQVAKVDIPQKR